MVPISSPEQLDFDVLIMNKRFLLYKHSNESVPVIGDNLALVEIRRMVWNVSFCNDQFCYLSIKLCYPKLFNFFDKKLIMLLRWGVSNNLPVVVVTHPVRDLVFSAYSHAKNRLISLFYTNDDGHFICWPVGMKTKMPFSFHLFLSNCITAINFVKCVLLMLHVCFEIFHCNRRISLISVDCIVMD